MIRGSKPKIFYWKTTLMKIVDSKFNRSAKRAWKQQDSRRQWNFSLRV
jgi:hypothetical protein